MKSQDNSRVSMNPQEIPYKNELNITEGTFIHDQRQDIKESKEEDSCCGFLSFVTDFMKLYTYAEGKQKWAIAFGVFLGLISGVSYPLFIYVWCSEIELTMQYNGHLLEHIDQFRDYMLIFIGMGLAVLVFNSSVFMVWKYISKSISKKIRVKYLEAFIRKSIAELQKKSSYEWANNFKTHTLNIQKSIGDKVALLLNLIGIISSGIIAALSIRWTLTLYMFLLLPFGLAIVIYFMYNQLKKKEVNIQSNKTAQSKVLQATAMIKTVKMLNGEKKELDDYVENLLVGQRQLSGFNIKLGFSTALFYFIQSIFVSVGFLMGIQCVRGTNFCPESITGSKYKISQLLIVFYQLFFCSYNFLQLGSNYNIIKSAIASSKQLYPFIQEENSEKDLIKEKRKLSTIGKIQFNQVDFSYPLNEDKRILQNLTLQFQQFGFNALTGSTGSGKSTIIQLLLKQYQPQNGKILVNGINLNEISTSHWLDTIGVVSQQPVLFDGTIRENILAGKQDASDEEIIEALRLANIYTFVTSNPDGLNFEIGVGGSKLSGGQKQRIAIARALVKKPKLLILDEATSALDPNTEREIQQTFESIRQDFKSKMTIICIAHRLKTIKNSDMIFLLQGGSVLEKGKFEDIQNFRQIEEQNQEQQSFEILRIKPGISKNFIPKEEKVLQVLNDEKKEDQANIQKTVYSHLFSYTEHKVWYIICLFLAVVIGIIHASSGLLLAYSLDQQNMLYFMGINVNWCVDATNAGNTLCSTQLDNYLNQAQCYLYGLFGYAFVTFIPYIIQVTMLSKIQNEIAFNIRKDLYKKMLSLEVSYFQLPENESGGAATRFGNDTRQACGLLTNYLPIIISNFSTVIGAVVICFIYDWRFGFVSILVTPLIALAFYIAMLFIGGYEDTSLQKMHKADQVANQLIVTIKTSFVLNYQEKILERYKREIQEPIMDNLKIGAKIGGLYGSALLILEFVTGLALYLSVYIAGHNLEIKPLTINVFMIVSILSGFVTGNNFYFIAHISVGKEAAKRVMELVNAQTEIQKQKFKQLVTIAKDKQEVQGRIQFKNVSFKYKDSDSHVILKNISFVIEPGSKVAFVGASGCGKSTIMQLLLRFYDFQGEILLDGENIYKYKLPHYRSYFGMLNQQPSLFSGTIKKNILYNIKVKESKLKKACQWACAFSDSSYEPLDERITTFQEKLVGSKGANISGGEKQRVACARALIRNANVFLMDEGTSALDRTTEMSVQRNLDKKFKGRGKTMIVIAHRVETIINSDLIFVFDHGELKQHGSYRELMKRKEFFYNFAKGQKQQS